MKSKIKINIKSIILCSFFAALTAIGAFIKIPMPPPLAPITMQFMVVALSGVLLGSRDAILSQLIYVLIGLIGFPVFTNGGGPQYIFQPTFGFLFGFIIASFVIGYMTERYKKITLPKLFLSCSIGLLIVYILGISHLYIIKNFYTNTPAPLDQLIYSYAIVFIPKDLISSFIAAALCKKLIYIIRSGMA